MGWEWEGVKVGSGKGLFPIPPPPLCSRVGERGRGIHGALCRPTNTLKLVKTKEKTVIKKPLPYFEKIEIFFNLHVYYLRSFNHLFLLLTT